MQKGCLLLLEIQGLTLWAWYGPPCQSVQRSQETQHRNAPGSSGVAAHILSATMNQDLFLYTVTPTTAKHLEAGPCEPSFQKGTPRKAPVCTDSISVTLA